MHMMITTDRQSFVATAAAAAAAALTAAPQVVSAALDSQRDASLARPPPPARLLPIMKVKLRVEGIQALLGDPAGWEAAREKLMDKALSKSEYRRVFDEYSTDNWGSHILADLYRNQGLEQLDALSDLLRYLLEQQAKLSADTASSGGGGSSSDGGGSSGGSGGGGGAAAAILPEDIADLRACGDGLMASIDAFLSLAPPADVAMVERAVRAAAAATSAGDA
ncbi:hypothetical protein JKP88DRAFT_255435 [Tribonema minus]|uniref:Uncharacterized protein n=1 Tax=Tribonema minus TaxID=303371 RepID=A0A836CFE8_9STRA|nr:hypothetical protein JKP88DRAFT_255435 [Tribonema minus]